MGKRLTREEFIEKAKAIHGDRYDYSKVVYVNNKTKVCIIDHTKDKNGVEYGEFWQYPNNHLQGSGGPKRVSTSTLPDSIDKICNIDEDIERPEKEIAEYLQGLGCQCENRYYCFLSRKETEIYLPSLNIVIRYDRLRSHSEEFCQGRNYHRQQTIQYEENGIHLIHIFEDEWVNKKEIVLAKLRHIVGKSNGEKIFARKCFVREVERCEAEKFLNTNHIQGFVGSTLYFGALYEERLIAVMTFKSEGKNSNKWELTRFATDINLRCIGLGGKLFTYFVKKYNPLSIKSFADRRWTSVLGENLYTRLGFQLTEALRPEYRYIIPNRKERYHKFAFRKQKLHRKYGLPLTMTECEMTQELGFYRIWDCGLLRYEYLNRQRDTESQSLEDKVKIACHVIGVISDNVCEWEAYDLTPKQHQAILDCIKILEKAPDNSVARQALKLGKYMVDNYPIFILHKFGSNE